MNRVFLFFLTSVVAIILGWGVGGYITYNKTIEAVGKIPASPIVVKTVYDRKNHTVVFSVLNTGTLPLTVVSESFVFKPGKESAEKQYKMENIPAHITLIPLGITTVSLKLKKGSQELKSGDIVMATLHYVHPLSDDIYTVSHKFEFTGKPQETPLKKVK
ncbi:hypothetical protein SAMN06265182_0335 [Persephonella hydrogeniphila]|uniref:Uncharacterized protein n=1 Tax=Persephonella hydrogeniphila TaxID=198703 RepID=A0A285N2U3_9AQUI|nr:hypothetical protein [Persephonella hydrogeniphila]SNZ03263.1 hypothetical protein SAMN06265182_0335 [Persephonella hydrogeniphila]